MTCRILIVTPDGYATQARALLNSASSTSFITEPSTTTTTAPEAPAHPGRWDWWHSSRTALSSVVAFRIAPDKPNSNDHSGPHWDVEAVVLPRITTDLPTSPVSFNKRCKYLSGLRLVDLEFNIPGHIDVLLGIDVFSHVILHGR